MTSPGAELPTPDDVDAAAQRIRPHVRRTPIIQVSLGGREVWLKLEQLQVTGSFKARGATNAVLSLPHPPTAVVAASGGNHGLGVAHAAAAVGATATVVVPENVPAEKARRLTAAGATVVRFGDRYAQAQAHAQQLAADLGAAFVHAYADAPVIAGQGTVGAEILEDLSGRIDSIIVAVGGGGLISGIATAAHNYDVRVVGVEPVGIPTLHAALGAGEPVQVDVDSVAASALGASITGKLNLAIAQRSIQTVVLVNDADILAARDLLWDELRLAVEPGAAAGLAALLAGAVEAEAPCVVICGANAAWSPA